MVSTKASIRRRYDKLVTRSKDPSTPEAERRKAREAASAVEREHPWVKAKPAPPPPPTGSTPPPPRATTPTLADVLVKGATAAATAWMADRVDHFARRADQTIDRAFGALGVETSMGDTHPDRMSNADLVREIEIAGAILPTGEDEEDESNDVVAVVLLVNVDVAAAIADRGEDGARKLEGMIGRSVAVAMAETVDKGEYGDWPFGDEDDAAEA